MTSELFQSSSRHHLNQGLGLDNVLLLFHIFKGETMLKTIPAAIACIGLTTLLTACNDKSGSEAVKLDNQTAKASYSIGSQFGSQVAQAKDMIDQDALIMGFKDSMNGKELQITKEEMQTVMQTFQQAMMEKQMAKQKVEQSAASTTNKAEGDKFLADNKSKEGVKTTQSGLQYKVLKEGTGDMPKISDTVVTHYSGTLINGKVFDSSYKRNSPATFPVNGVIKGWTEALQLMGVGAKWQLFIPAELAYGERGAGQDIGPNQVLIFEIELLEIKKS